MSSEEQCYMCATALLLPYFRCSTCQNNLQDELERRNNSRKRRKSDLSHSRREHLNDFHGDPRNNIHSRSHNDDEVGEKASKQLRREDFETIQICSSCFARGAEKPPHRNFHDYKVIVSSSTRIITITT